MYVWAIISAEVGHPAFYSGFVDRQDSPADL
jgi:hypothetical protein